MKRLFVAALVAGLVAACGSATSSPVANHGSPGASAERSVSPSPAWFGTPAAPLVLAPANVLPVASLCTYSAYETADGNFEPRFCSDGSINVDAWRLYASFAPHILGAGKDATVGQIDAALRADFDGHATNVETIDSYQLAAAYYGWTFSPNPACELTYQTATCY